MKQARPVTRSPARAGRPAAPPLTWGSASTLPELGEMTARWLTGIVVDHPCIDTIPDQRAAHLIGLLAAANRAGLLTDFSQPGLPDRGDGVVQRAAVSGWCDAALCRRLVDTLGPTDVVLLAENSIGSVRVPVTLEDGVAGTWLGGRPSTEGWAAALPVEGLATLATSWYVSAFDPVWGRNDRLWPILAEALDLPADVAAAACTEVF